MVSMNTWFSFQIFQPLQCSRQVFFLQFVGNVTSTVKLMNNGISQSNSWFTFWLICSFWYWEDLLFIYWVFMKISSFFFFFWRTVNQPWKSGLNCLFLKLMSELTLNFNLVPNGNLTWTSDRAQTPLCTLDFQLLFFF